MGFTISTLQTYIILVALQYKPDSELWHKTMHQVINIRVLTLENRAFPSVLHVSKVFSFEPAGSVAEDAAVNDDRLDEDGIDGSFSLHRGPSSCCSIALHLHQQTSHFANYTVRDLKCHPIYFKHHTLQITQWGT